MEVFHFRKGAYPVARLDAAPLSPTAAERRQALSLSGALLAHWVSAGEGAQVVGVSRVPVYRWRQRARASGPQGLELGSPKLNGRVERLNRTWRDEFSDHQELPDGAPRRSHLS
jgi:hypothetical protein